MPSSGKTPNIGLNLWSGSDSPKMEDFNNDNTIIDSAIKALQDGQGGGGEEPSGLSLIIGTYRGNGADYYTLNVDPGLKFAVIFADLRPVVFVDSSDGNSAVYSIAFITPDGSTQGSSYSSGNNEILLLQETEGYGGSRMNMNQDGVTYCYALFY